MGEGERGVLEYRGFPIETLAEHSCFEEVSWLLLRGQLPTAVELEGFRAQLAAHRQLPDRMVRMLEALPGKGHPMAALQAAVAALGMFSRSPDLRDPAELDLDHVQERPRLRQGRAALFEDEMQVDILAGAKRRFSRHRRDPADEVRADDPGPLRQARLDPDRRLLARLFGGQRLPCPRRHPWVGHP